MKRTRTLFSGLLCLACWTAFAPAQDLVENGATTQTTQSATDVETTTTVSVEEIEALQKQVEADTKLADVVKTELITLYKQAIDQAKAAATWRARTDTYRKGQEEAPALVKDLKAKLEEEKAKPAVVDDNWDDEPTEQLTQATTQAEADLTQRREQLKQLDDEAQARAGRRKEIPSLLANAASRQAAAKDALAALATATATPNVVAARRTLLFAQRAALREESTAIQEELRFYDARSDVLSTRRDLAQIAVTRAEALVERLRTAVNKRREEEAKQQQRQAEQDIKLKPHAVQELAEQNKKLAQERTELGRLIVQAEQQVKTATAEKEQLATDYKRLQALANQHIATSAAADLMRRQRSDILDLRRKSRNLEQSLAQFVNVQTRLEEIEDQRRALLNLDEAANAVVETMISEGVTVDHEVLRAEVRDLLASQSALLDDLKRDYDAYSVDLSDVQTALSELLVNAEVAAKFIEERVLWLRSTEPLHRTSFPIDIAAGLSTTGALREALLRDARMAWPAYVFCLGGVVTVLLARMRICRALTRLGELTEHPFSDRFGYTLRSLFYTTVLAAPFPALLAFMAWRLDRIGDAASADAYAAVLGSSSLHSAATALFVLSFIGHALRRHGLCEAHFGWPAPALRVVRRRLISLYWPTGVLLFITAVAERCPDERWAASWGRVAFLLLLALLTFSAISAGRAVRQTFARDPQAGAKASLRPRVLPRFFIVGVPAALAIASYVGYHYTALEIASRIGVTIVIGGAVVLAHALARRWVTYAQRQLAISEARRKRQAQARADGEAKTGEATITEDELSIGQIGEQTRRVLRSFAWLGLVLAAWGVWDDLLPALRFMEDVTLWSYVTQEVDVNGATKLVNNNVTLANAAGATFILVATFVLARNIPGLLEILILSWTSLDSGSRFAAAMLTRYLITVVGLVLAFGAMGVGWSKVQWLVAAVTVGLGFGLQEIFANFVSGLILLFERPIRIGDTVTVGEITGTVSRMRIRATTVTDWDRKELVIPNKEFVTGQVVNWSLSDRVLRLVVKVGVAYGSDTRKTKEILLRLAEENAKVLSTPKPQAWFVGFGDSALDFELRVFTRDLDDWVIVRDAMHTAIDDAFRAAGIEIAFPQRDIHIRTAPAALTGASPQDAPRT